MSRVLVDALVGGAVLSLALCLGALQGAAPFGDLAGANALLLSYALAALAGALLVGALRVRRREAPDAFRGDGPGLHVLGGAGAGAALSALVGMGLLWPTSTAWTDFSYVPLVVLLAPLALVGVDLPPGGILPFLGTVAGAVLGWLAWRLHRGRGWSRPPFRERGLALTLAGSLAVAVLVLLDLERNPGAGLGGVAWALVAALALAVGTVAGLRWLWLGARSAQGRREGALAGAVFGAWLGTVAAWTLGPLLEGLPPSRWMLLQPFLGFVLPGEGWQPRETAGTALLLACVALGAWLGARFLARRETSGRPGERADGARRL